MKVCLQGAAFDTGNMGVSALAVGSVRAILHGYPEAEVYFLNYDKSPVTYTIQFPGRQVSVPLVNMRFSWKFWLPNNIAFLLFLTVLMKLVPFAGLRRRWIAGNNCLCHLDESDLVLAISGGDSFSDIYGLERLIYVSLPQILALWAGKRLILLPQTLGPFKSRFAQGIAKYIMKRAEVVYARDHAGVKLARAMLQESGVRGPESEVPSTGSRTPSPESRVPIRKVRFCYDVGFLLEPMPPEQMDIAGIEIRSPSSQVPHPESRVPCRVPLVGLNVSGLLYMGGYTRNNAFGLRADYRTLTYRLIEFLIEQKKADVLLIPHVFSAGGESDTVICDRIFTELEGKYPDSLGLVRGVYNQSEIKYIIGLCDFFSGSRMHACIAALSQNVPAVAIAYSDKFAGVMESIGVGSIVVDPRKMSEDEILEAVGQTFDARTTVREQLARTIPHVKEIVLGMFSQVQGLPE